MTPTKLLVGQIFVVFAMVIAGVWIATQWCAAQLGYHLARRQADIEGWLSRNDEAMSSISSAALTGRNG